MQPDVIIAALYNGAQGVLNQLHSHVVQLAVENQQLFLELRQVLHPALYIGPQHRRRLHRAAAAPGGHADYKARLVVDIHKGVGHSRKVIAAPAAPVKKGLLQYGLLQLRVFPGVYAGEKPVLLGFAALGADDILHNLR